MWILFLLAIDVIMFIVEGFVLKTLWNWFVVPIFEIPNLTIASAIGIAIVVSMFTAREQPDEREVGEVITARIAHNLTHAAMALITGWIVLQFM